MLNKYKSGYILFGSMLAGIGSSCVSYAEGGVVDAESWQEDEFGVAANGNLISDNADDVSSFEAQNPAENEVAEQTNENSGQMEVNESVDNVSSESLANEQKNGISGAGVVVEDVVQEPVSEVAEDNASNEGDGGNVVYDEEVDRIGGEMLENEAADGC